MSASFPEKIVRGVKVEGLWEIYPDQVSGLAIECLDGCGNHLGKNGTAHHDVGCGCMMNWLLFNPDTVNSLPKPEVLI